MHSLFTGILPDQRDDIAKITNARRPSRSRRNLSAHVSNRRGRAFV